MGPTLDFDLHTAIEREAEEEQRTQSGGRKQRSHLAGMVGRFQRRERKN